MTWLFLAEIPEIPGPLVAMIFIIFIQWLVRKIRGPQEELTEEEILEAQRLEEEMERQILAEQEEARRRYMEQTMGGGVGPPVPVPVNRPEPPRVSTPKPPPIPSWQKPKAPETPRLNAAEQRALDLVKQREAVTQQAADIRRSTRGIGDTQLEDLLYDPASLRNAIVLKEVLDKPVALRDDEDRFY